MTSRSGHDHATEKFLHSHAFGSHNHEGERRTAWVTGLTIATMVAEIVAGWVTGSMALLADGWHMGTHAAALGIAWAAFAFARKHANDRRFTFGTGKVGVLGAFASSIVLAGVAVFMFVESGKRLAAPTPIRFDQALLVAIIGLAVNLASAWLLGGAGVHAHNHTHGNPHDEHGHGPLNSPPQNPSHQNPPRQDYNVRAAYIHVLADAMTSVLAIAALLVVRQWGWAWADPLMGLVGGAVILRWAWGLARETGHILVDGDVEAKELDAIRHAVESDGDSTVTDLHVWRVGVTEKAAILCVVARQPRSPSHYRTVLQQFRDLKHASVEVNACAVCTERDSGEGAHQP